MHQVSRITLCLFGLFFLSAAGSAQAQKESGHKNHLSHLFGCEDSGSLCAEREDNVSYDPETLKLTVTFQNGRVYEYAQVPEQVAQDFANAPSVGSALNSEIKPNYSFNRIA